MRSFTKPFGLFVLVTGLAASAPLRAAPIVWQLVGVTFSDGAIASGSFTYDEDRLRTPPGTSVSPPGFSLRTRTSPTSTAALRASIPQGQVDFWHSRGVRTIYAPGVRQPVDEHRRD